MSSTPPPPPPPSSPPPPPSSWGQPASAPPPPPVSTVEVRDAAPASFGTETAIRIVAAVGLLGSGLVHLDLYFRYGYRDITTANVGRAFLTNGILAIVISALLLIRRDAILRIAGLAVAAGTLIAFVMSRTLDDGFFGFTEKGMNPSPQAQIALICEILAILALVASFVPGMRWRQQAIINPVVGIALAGAFVAIGVVSSVVWANSDGASTSYGPGSGDTAVTRTVAAGGEVSTDAVTIKGFAFDPKELDVKVGDTVTWTNEDGAAHTVKSPADAFEESADLGQGDTFSHTFDQAGTFDYICGIHTGMKATVVVSD